MCGTTAVARSLDCPHETNELDRRSRRGVLEQCGMVTGELRRSAREGFALLLPPPRNCGCGCRRQPGYPVSVRDYVERRQSQNPVRDLPALEQCAVR